MQHSGSGWKDLTYIDPALESPRIALPAGSVVPLLVPTWCCFFVCFFDGLIAARRSRSK